MVRILLEFLTIVNLLFALFPAWRLSPLWNYIPVDGYFKVWMATLDKINVLVCLAILVIQHRIRSKGIFLLVVLLFLAVFISMFANGMPTGLTTLICFPLEYIVICVIARDYSFGSRIIKITFVMLALWSILPLFVMFAGSINYQIAMMSDVYGRLSTFGGFAFHRNFYGFYAGLTIILALFIPMRSFWKVSIILLCLTGIMLSASRSALMCTFAAILLFYYLTNKKKFISMLPFAGICVALILSAYTYFNLRSKGLEDNDDRFEILRGFGEFIMDKPLLGNGEAMIYYSAHYPMGAPAHNFVVQVWADYGLITLLVMLGFLALIYFKSNVYLKVLLIYLLLFGLSQPYFYLSMPAAFMMITFLLGNCVDFSNLKGAKTL